MWCVLQRSPRTRPARATTARRTTSAWTAAAAGARTSSVPHLGRVSITTRSTTNDITVPTKGTDHIAIFWNTKRVFFNLLFKSPDITLLCNFILRILILLDVLGFPPVVFAYLLFFPRARNLLSQISISQDIREGFLASCYSLLGD